MFAMLPPPRSFAALRMTDGALAAGFVILSEAKDLGEGNR